MVWQGFLEWVPLWFRVCRLVMSHCLFIYSFKHPRGSRDSQKHLVIKQVLLSTASTLCVWYRIVYTSLWFVLPMAS